MDVRIILLGILIGVSFIAGYIIGEFTRNEIKETAERISKFLNIWYFIIELALIFIVFIFEPDFIYTFAGIITILNLFFGALFTALKSDFNRLLVYAIVMIIAMFVMSLI